LPVCLKAFSRLFKLARISKSRLGSAYASLSRGNRLYLTLV
jgi:hypothetical protein